jgi:hypothetical protein
VAARLVGEGDVVAGLDRGDGGADPADDAGALMAKNRRQRHRQFLVPDVDVGLAQAGSRDLDEHFPGAQAGIQIQFAYLERAARLFDHGRPDAQAVGVAGVESASSFTVTGMSPSLCVPGQKWSWPDRSQLSYEPSLPPINGCASIQYD